MKPSPISNDTSSAENLGPPDSHEAMNNREFHSSLTKVREKRSYEFLMGIINNNSRYEVTRIDTEPTHQPKVATKSASVGASEILLELMVRIASHPDQWDKVHKLLQTIDQDLQTSRSVVTQLQNLSNSTENNHTTNAKKSISNVNNNVTITDSDQISNKTDVPNKTIIKTGDNKLDHQLAWPSFDEDENNTQIVNNDYIKLKDSKFQHNAGKTKNKTNKSAFPKNFTYHRVTGKPNTISKNPRAYIAVSVIAPKPALPNPANSDSEEDLTLENELHQLKPWNHLQNLKNMESLRSKWMIQKNSKNKKS